jgi:putative ABC transport system substrate-binding protein
VPVSRRAFLTGAAGLCALPTTVHGQGAAKVFRIGFLGTTSPKAHGAFLEAFREGLREQGYVEGKNVKLEPRWAENDYSRLPGLAAELVRLKVDVILTHGTPGSQAVKAATSSIPIVVAIIGDAVATGLVPSLARPGGNLTGSSFFFSEVNAKRVELLKEALPGLTRIAVLLNDSNPSNVATIEAVTRTARTAGIETLKAFASSTDDFEAAFTQMTQSRSEAVVVYEDPLFIAQVTRLAHLAERTRLPSAGFTEYATAGGLFGFGVNFRDVWRRAAGFVDRIFKGAKPSDLPMEPATTFDTVVNLRTARALQLTIPQKVLLRAETVLR